MRTKIQAVSIQSAFPGPDLTTPQVRFWGWTENKREEDLDLAELRQHVAEGKPLHPESSQPRWIQDVAYRNSAWSQLKFRECPPCGASPLLTRLALRGIPDVRRLVSSSQCNILNLHRFNFVNHQHHGTDPAKYSIGEKESA